ncbi:MAG: outer membrane beta-barrel protein [Chlorobiales bacterium]|nr:outer membrane beta-barrel protein [Chlorobiales bacterium]
MKSFMSVCAALLVFFASAPLAQAAANPYVGLSAGIALLQNSDIKAEGLTDEDAIEYATGYAVNGALGIDGGMYRIEGAVGYQANDIDVTPGGPVDDDEDVSLSILSFLANGYIDIGMSGSVVEPYVMAGAGVATVTLSDEGVDEGSTAFAYQFGAGVGIQATPNVVLDLGYRYFATADVTYDEIPDGEMDVTVASHNIMAGVRVGF